MQTSKDRDKLIKEAQEAVAISYAGRYEWLGDSVELELGPMREGSRFFGISKTPETNLLELSGRYSTVVTVRDMTTLAAADELAQGTTSVGVLNFASAKNPGGGFLRGTVAQEESIARSSALFAGLVAFQEEFYEAHRREGDQLYTDRAIWTPKCPVFRDGRGLISSPYYVNFVTCAAPNLTSLMRSTYLYRAVAQEITKRVVKILTIFAWGNCEVLVLGAWGCGVFKNDPVMVAQAFSNQLRGKFKGIFERVIFAIPAGPNFEAFSAVLADSK